MKGVYVNCVEMKCFSNLGHVLGANKKKCYESSHGTKSCEFIKGSFRKQNY